MKIKRPRKKFLLIFFILGCAVLFCSGADASPFEDTVRILEGRTAFHWGRDCFVWMVHYADALVDPWVEAEAGRVGMSDAERDSYRNSFMTDLSMETAEPVLMTVHAFGARPLDLSPLSEKIALVTSSGQRLKPVRYDRILDEPLSGVIQGLVFFPKQDDPEFAVALSGLGVFDERIFSFAGGEPAFVPAADAAAPVDEPVDEPEIVVVELPPAPKPEPEPQPRRAQPSEAQPPRARPPEAQPPREQPAVTSEPPVPPAPPAPPVPPEPEPVQPTQPEPEIIVIDPESAQDVEQDNQDVAYSSREQTLRTFLDLWIKSDPGAMHAMLSEPSRELFPRQAFEAELNKSPDFRNAIKDGYTLDWLGPDRAKIVAIRRFLFIRTLLSRTLGVVREGAAWKIVW